MVRCPVCGEEFETALKALYHVKRSTDDEHAFLATLMASPKIKAGEIEAVGVVYTEALAAARRGDLEAATAARQEVDAKIAFAEKQAKERLKAAELFRLRKARLDKTVSEFRALSTERERKQAEDKYFACLPENDRPAALVNFFYGLTEGRSVNFPRDVSLVKRLYVDSKLSPGDVRDVMRYMHAIGERSLSLLNHCVEDALYTRDALVEARQEGTPASLALLFYEKRGRKPSARTFHREVKAIAASLRDGVPYEVARRTVTTMAEDRKNNPPLLWFASRVDRECDRLRAVAEDASLAFDVDREAKEAVEQVLRGKLRVDDVSATVRPRVNAAIVDRLVKGEFDERYTYLEWAFKAGVDLDARALQFAKARNDERPSRFAWAMSHVTDPAKRERFKAQYDEFLAWLARQEEASKRCS